MGLGKDNAVRLLSEVDLYHYALGRQTGLRGQGGQREACFYMQQLERGARAQASCECSRQGLASVGCHRTKQ